MFSSAHLNNFNLFKTAFLQAKLFNSPPSRVKYYFPTLVIKYPLIVQKDSSPLTTGCLQIGYEKSRGILMIKSMPCQQYAMNFGNYFYRLIGIITEEHAQIDAKNVKNCYSK